MAAVELATGYVTLAVETRGINAQVAKAFQGAGSTASTAGQNMGRSMAKSFNSTKPNIDTLRADFENAQKRVAQQADISARKQEAAKRKVDIAQAKLNETTEKYGAKSSQALSAADRLSTAEQKLTAETMSAKSAQDKLQAELGQTKGALDKAAGASATASKKYATGWKGVGQRIKGFVKGGVKMAAGSGTKEAQTGGKRAGSAFGTAFKGMVTGALAVVSVRAIGGFVKTAVTGAGDLEQSIGAVEAVFKGSSDSVLQWGKDAADSVGLSQNAYNESATLMGSLFKNMGFDQEEVAKKTKGSITLASDLAAMYGGPVTDSVEALTAARKGEFNQLEKYGVTVNMTRINSEAEALGLKKVGKEYSANQKEIALMSLLTKQTADAQGQFAKESDTFAHKQQVMRAKWENLTTTIGGFFMPVFTKVFSFIGDKAIPALSKFFGWIGKTKIFTEITGAIKAFGAAWEYNDGEITSSGLPGFFEFLGYTAHQIFGEISGAVKAFAAAWKYNDGEITSSGLPGVMERLGYWARQTFDFFGKTAIPTLSRFGKKISENKGLVDYLTLALKYITIGFIAWKVAVGAVSVALKIGMAVQKLFYAVMALNPFGLIVIAIGLLVAAVVWLYKNNETARKVIDTVWKAIKTSIKVSIDFIINIFKTVVKWVTVTLPGAFGKFKANSAKNWTDVKNGIGGAWNGIKGFFGGIKSWTTTTLPNAFNNFKKNSNDNWILVKGGVKNAWTGIHGAWSSMVGYLGNKLGPKFTWLKDKIIIPVFGGIAKNIKSVWNNGIKPIFSIFMDVIKGDLPSAFKKGRALIDTIWSGLKSIAKAPIKFIVDVVINKGLIGAFNAVAGFIDKGGKIIKPLKEVHPKGFDVGGYTGDGAKMEKAGDVHRGEFVFQKSATKKLRKSIGLPGLYHMNKTGEMPGFSAGGLVGRPVNGPTTSGFGASRSGYTHAGQDFAVPIGTLVHAALAGIIRKSGTNAVPGRTGKGMLVDHSDNRSTYYGHLSSFISKVGDRVSAGQAIARSGNTGRSTGPHLHFETWVGGKPVNPAKYLGKNLPGGEGGGGFLGFDPMSAFTGLKDKMLKQFTDKFPGGGKILEIAGGVGGKLLDVVPSFIKRKFGDLLQGFKDFAGGAINGAKDDLGKSAGALKYRGMAKAALKHTGDYSFSNLNSLMKRMRQESSFNPKAINLTDSNARRGTPSKGLMQVIDPTFASYRDRSLGNDIWDPYQNTVASIRYTKARYGNVQTGWNRSGGYFGGGLVDNLVPFLHDGGGYLNPGKSVMENRTKAPEPVLTAPQWDTMFTIADGVRAGKGGDVYHIENITIPVEDIRDIQDVTEFFQSLRRKTRQTVGARGK